MYSLYVETWNEMSHVIHSSNVISLLKFVWKQTKICSIGFNFTKCGILFKHLPSSPSNPNGQYCWHKFVYLFSDESVKIIEAYSPPSPNFGMLENKEDDQPKVIHKIYSGVALRVLSRCVLFFVLYLTVDDILMICRAIFVHSFDIW